MKDIFIAILLFLLVYTWYVTASDNDSVREHNYSESLTQQRVEKAFEQWGEKRQIDSVWALYDEKTRFVDLNNDSVVIGRSAIRSYLFWDRIASLNPRQRVFVLDDLLSTPDAAVLSGYFLPFKRGARVEEYKVPFFTKLKFDSSGVIKEQIWWERY